MNAASRLTLHLALAAAAGYAGAAYHLRTEVLAEQPRTAGMVVQTSAGSAPARAAASRATAVSYRDAALRAATSVVTVYGSGGDAAPGVVAVASGVVVGREGLVVTTSEVAAHSGTVAVTLPDGSQRPARLVGADPGVGLALLKVEGAALGPMEMSGPGAVAVGDPVLALGDALGLGPTVTQGIVSALRPAQLEGSRERLDFIQTDASIHPGNFGGALVDTDGRLVGIVVGTVGPDGTEGLALAVPADRIGKLMTRLRQPARAERERPRVVPDRGRFTEVSFPARSVSQGD